MSVHGPVRDPHFPHIPRQCAVKEMINSIQDPELHEKAFRNFEREAGILATLDHPSIPKIYDYYIFGDRAYLVMEYIQGRDLEALLSDTDAFLPVHTVRPWAIDICDALSYLHSHRPEPIIFRVMKLGNIMIDQRRQVYLVDFGIGRPFLPDHQKKVAETANDYSPERDLYDLGLALFRVLTRYDPGLEPPNSVVRPISAYNPNVPDALAAVVMKAVSYDANDRYSSAEEMKQALIAAGT